MIVDDSWSHFYKDVQNNAILNNVELKRFNKLLKNHINQLNSSHK